MTSAQADGDIRERFGPYTLVRKIGQGGMAEVFLAYPEGAKQGDQPVVVKRLHQELEHNRDAVDLFLTEADVTMMLTHPNVIRKSTIAVKRVAATTSPWSTCTAKT